MVDFSMFAGDSKVIKVTVNDEAGAAVDISAASIRWQLAVNAGAVPLLSKALGSGIALADAPAGKFNVTLDSADTQNLNGGSYYYEAEIIDSGIVSTVLTGNVQINPALIR
jgi:hypothetical protein